MSDDIMPETQAASSPSDAPNASSTNGVPGEPRADGGDQPPRPRRRRGSRGGRNRRKRPAAVNAGADDATRPDEFVAHDYTDAAADRGLTTDDVADVAREEAGLPSPPLV